MIERCCLDMDGVSADFHLAVCYAHNVAFLYDDYPETRGTGEFGLAEMLALPSTGD